MLLLTFLQFKLLFETLIVSYGYRKYSSLFTGYEQSDFYDPFSFDFQNNPALREDDGLIASVQMR